MHPHQRWNSDSSLISLPHGTVGNGDGPPIATHIQTPTTKEIATGSLGCCQIANRSKRHPQLNNNYITLMNPLQHYLKAFKGKLRWTPANPEKRNSMSANWSRNNCLNHVADIVAGGLIDFDIDFQYNFIQLPAEDIMESLILPSAGHRT